MRTTLASAFALLAALAVAHPAAAQLKMGNNNSVTQTGVITGAQLNNVVGAGLAMNGNASIMSASSVTLGNNNNITQTGHITGAQLNTVVGAGVAMNGNASIMAGH